jgi:hypothetical protein
VAYSPAGVRASPPAATEAPTGAELRAAEWAETQRRTRLFSRVASKATPVAPSHTDRRGCGNACVGRASGEGLRGGGHRVRLRAAGRGSRRPSGADMLPIQDRWRVK